MLGKKESVDEDGDPAIEWKEGEDQGLIKDDGIKMTSAYYDQVAKDFRPQLVEMGFHMDVEGIPFKGFIDYADVDGNIIDFKTTGRTPNKDIAETSIQLVAYALGYKELTGEREKSVALDYVVNLKKEKKIVQFQSAIDEERTNRFTETVKQVGNAISSGIFFRNEEGMACGFCSFKDMCKGV